MLKALTLTAVGLAGVTLAQEGGEIANWDFASWFSSPHALAVVVVGLVSLLRKHFVKLDGLLVPALALVLGLLLSLFGSLLGYLQGSWVAFGFQAGLEAVLAVAGVRTLLQPLAQKGGNEDSKSQGPSTPTPVTPPPKLK